MTPPRRVIIDASSLVRAVLKPGAAAWTLVEVVLAAGALAANGSILDELEDVLRRPKFQDRIAEADRARFLDKLRGGAVRVAPREAVQACRDPSDDKYLEVALAAAEQATGSGAVVIASDDQDLLALHPWRGIAILKPEAVLALFGDK